MRTFFYILLITGIVSCKRPVNRFEDETMRTIATLQDERNAKALLPYLAKDVDHDHRMAAITAFGSVQDTASVPALMELLDDGEQDIRIHAAYALGQTRYGGAEDGLLKAVEKEPSPAVKAELIEALGKCGGRRTMNWLNKAEYGATDSLLAEAQAWAWFQLGNRRITSDTATIKALKLLDHETMPVTVRIAASAYLARARGIDLTAHIRPIVKSVINDKNIYVRMNAARAMGKVNEDAVLFHFDLVLQFEKDYRVKVNTVYAFRIFNYQLTGPRLLKVVMDKNPHIAQAAAEIMLDRGDSTDVRNYLERAEKVKHWRARALLLSASLKHERLGGSQDSISALIRKRYEASTDDYEKSNLLAALGQSPANYRFIAAETFSGKNVVISTYGMEALAAIRKHKRFGKNASDSIYGEFAGYFKKGIESGDASLVAIAAGVLGDTTLKITYDDISFLKNTQAKLKMPRDIETFIELQKTIDRYEGRETKDLPKAAFNNPIDWEMVKTISSDKTVVLQTSKGDITLQLMVDEAPGSVANFLKLARQGFYNDKVFHRVVPNFVIQGGCPRGDGWGNSDNTIRSELPPLHYYDGYLGMASAGKDTEGCQWFITHSPTPHLDGTYSIFGKVINGMDVVHKIEMGDKILAINETGK